MILLYNWVEYLNSFGSQPWALKILSMYEMKEAFMGLGFGALPIDGSDPIQKVVLDCVQRTKRGKELPEVVMHLIES